MNQAQAPPVKAKPNHIAYEKMHRSLLSDLDDYNDGKEVGEAINSNEQATLFFIYDTFVRLYKDKSKDTKLITWTNGKQYACLVTNNQSLATQRGVKSEKTMRNHIKKLIKAGFMFKPKKGEDPYRKWFNFSIFLNPKHLITYAGYTIAEAKTKLPQMQKFYRLKEDFCSIEGIPEEQKQNIRKFSLQSFTHGTNSLVIECSKQAFEGIKNTPESKIYTTLIENFFGKNVSVQHVFNA
ncbi:hypothetical protein WAF17_02370 [Bernardetia sp. ABR2-2B]|uniref:hypothetical protein n=1 Tax=Bernardetia sp. ABR2-2B TaxID=3127472 RepID=UPI0030CD7959